MTFFGVFGQLFLILVTLGGLLLSLLLAMGVHKEASERAARGLKLWFVGPGLLAWGTLVGGVITAAVYWVLHHSTLGPVEATDSDDK